MICSSFTDVEMRGAITITTTSAEGRHATKENVSMIWNKETDIEGRDIELPP